MALLRDYGFLFGGFKKYLYLCILIETKKQYRI